MARSVEEERKSRFDGLTLAMFSSYFVSIFRCKNTEDNKKAYKSRIGVVAYVWRPRHGLPTNWFDYTDHINRLHFRSCLILCYISV